MANPNQKTDKPKGTRKPQGPRDNFVVITAPDGVRAEDVTIHYSGSNAKEVLETMERLRGEGKSPSYSKFRAKSRTANAPVA